MIKLCVFDVDGTLYDSRNGCVLPSTQEALLRLHNHGILIAVATGRVHYGLGKALNALNFDYVCAVNGGVIVDSKGNVLTRHNFTKEDVMQVNEFAYTHEAGLAWKFIDHVYIYSHPEKIDWYESQRNSDIGQEPFIELPSQDRHFIDLPQSASLHAPYEAVCEAFGESETIQCLRYSEDGFDVVLKGMNKGVCIEELSKLCGIKKEEIMVFGDNYNDLPMFDKAGLKVAMGNAIEEIKEKADFVSDDCSHDGIYKACIHFGLI